MSETPVVFLAFANDHQNYLYKLTEEQNAVRKALKQMDKEGLCEVVYETNTDLNKIWDTFNDYRDRIAIFHYGGHAEDYSLLLQKPNGEQQMVDGEGFVNFLGRQKSLQLVFLNGCSSKRQAEELRDKGVPAVIGTSEPINDNAAAILSGAFYTALAAGHSIEQAWLGSADLVRSDKSKKEKGFHRGIKLKDASGQYTKDFPWELYIRPGAENVKEWNLPRAARNPLFGLPLPEEAFLRLPKAPFVGLRYFREEDAAIFHGRGTQIRELYNHLQGIHPIILLYGKSGVGKSSMLDAGLLPRIRDEYEITYTRRIQEKGLLGTLDLALDELLGGITSASSTEESNAQGEKARQYLIKAAENVSNPQLRQEIERLLLTLEQEEKQDLLELSDILKKWQTVEQRASKPLVVILDQVEEKFTRPMPGMIGTGKDEIWEFLMAILPLFSGKDSGIRGKMILGYRKEYHPEIRDTFRFMSLPYAELFLKRLDREGIVEAVRGCTLHDTIANGQVLHNTKYNPYLLELEQSAKGNLPEIIADDLMEDPESPIATVLQIILDKLWQTTDKVEGQAVKLIVQQYQELRKQGTSMGEFFQEQMGKLTANQPEAVQSGLALDLLYAHTTQVGTAGSCRREDLFRQYDIDNTQLAEIIQELEDLSLLVRIDARERVGHETGNENYTTLLAHDTLATVVIREFNISDTPGQRAARILSHKVAYVGYQLPKDYLESLRQTGTPDSKLEELAKAYTGRDKFQTMLRNTLGEEAYQKQETLIFEQVQLSLSPTGQAIYLEDADLAIVENGTGINGQHFPGMRRLYRAEALLVEDSIRRRAERIRQEQKPQEKEQRLLEEKLTTERRAAKQQRIFSGVIGVAFLIALGFGFWALQQQSIAKENAKTARKKEEQATQSLQQFHQAEFEKVKAGIDNILEHAQKLEANYPEQQRALLRMAQHSLNEYSTTLYDSLKNEVNNKLKVVLE